MSLQEAVNEAKACARMGGLDDAMLADIAHDYDITVEALRLGLGWDETEVQG